MVVAFVTDSCSSMLWLLTFCCGIAHSGHRVLKRSRHYHLIILFVVGFTLSGMSRSVTGRARSCPWLHPSAALAFRVCASCGSRLPSCQFLAHYNYCNTINDILSRTFLALLGVVRGSLRPSWSPKLAFLRGLERTKLTSHCLVIHCGEPGILTLSARRHLDR